MTKYHVYASMEVTVAVTIPLVIDAINAGRAYIQMSDIITHGKSLRPYLQNPDFPSLNTMSDSILCQACDAVDQNMESCRYNRVTLSEADVIEQK